MKLLILGGTVFLGRHLVDAALAAKHEVTVFNRGRGIAKLPEAVEHLIGDRQGQLDALRGRRWNVAIDTCGYVPKVVHASAALLADHVEHYTFISTCSVYRDTSVQGIDESYPLRSISQKEVGQAAPQLIAPALTSDSAPSKTRRLTAALDSAPSDVNAKSRKNP
jgi:2'-hydroxyisoflavone reductase